MSLLLERYLEIKASVPNTVLFVGLGDFYETFETDAETVAMITGRPLVDANGKTMCGVHSLFFDGVLQQMAEAGYSVSVCEDFPEGRRSC